MRFTIKKGRHYSNPPRIRIHFGITKLKFKFKFSKECLYPINDADDYDINKLYGLSHGLHHRNSIRLGWASSASQVGRIDLFRYIYNKGARIPDYTPIATIDVEKWYEGVENISKLFKTASFAIREHGSGLSICTASTGYECPKFKLGYYLKPFFGGDHVSPHDMNIWIEELAY
jgi:hypothetical protein